MSVLAYLPKPAIPTSSIYETNRWKHTYNKIEYLLLYISSEKEGGEGGKKMRKAILVIIFMRMTTKETNLSLRTSSIKCGLKQEP